jgi:hypothetical protein
MSLTQARPSFWRDTEECGRAMILLRNLMSGIRSLFRKEERNREIDEELQGFFRP